MKQTHDLVQGSPAWTQFRLEHFGASEAAAMLGLSKTSTRSELLRVKHTGSAKEFSDWVQKNILDRGHQVEAMARPLIEELIGEDLYPVTLSDGKLSASCDGLTMSDTIAFEHKQWNEESAALVRAGTVPPEHMPQCQQVLMVSEAERLVFVVSDGTPERMVHVEVLPDPEWFERIRAGWDQFEKDLAEYVAVEPEPVAPIGKAPETLPALRIEITGEVKASNLEDFKHTALTAIRSVNRDLATDQDFADADKAIKWCGDVESRLDAAKEHALSQTASIDSLFKTIDDISAEARAVRLELTNLTNKRKGELKAGIVTKAKLAYGVHVTDLRSETEGLWINLTAPDFDGAAKNKRTIATLQDAVDVALANAKIDADASAKRIRVNLAWIAIAGVGFEFLFADKSLLIHKPLDDLKLIVQTRIDTHKAAEAEKARVAAAALAAAAAPAPAPASIAVENALVPGFALPRGYSVPDSVRAAVLRPATPEVGEVGTLNAGHICKRLGFALTVDFISTELGVPPATTEKRATLWSERQFKVICQKLTLHIMRVAAGEAVAA